MNVFRRLALARIPNTLLRATCHARNYGHEGFCLEGTSEDTCQFATRGFGTDLQQSKVQSSEMNAANQRLKEYSEIPGPTAWPLIKNLFYFVLRPDYNPKQIHLMWGNVLSEYGTIMKASFPGLPDMVITRNPDDIEVFLKSTLNNPIREAFKSLKMVRDNNPNDYFQKKAGLLPENGEEWWRLRRRVQGPLLRPRQVSSYLPQVDEATLQYMDRIDVLQRDFGHVPDNFLQDLYRWALEVADKTIKEAVQKLSSEKANDRAEDATLSIMETLLNTEGLSKSDVATMILDMLFAGVDTTSHTVAFTLFLLSRNPDVQKKLQSEVERVVGNSLQLHPDHIEDLVYLHYVVKESLRLYPLVVGNARILTNDVVMSGYKIPKGTLALGLNILICRDEKYFQKPSEFLPERWERTRPYGPIHPFASLPFSHGKRMCIGKRIAEQEIYTFLIRAMQRYTVSLQTKDDMDIVTNLVMKPSIPLPFTFTRRMQK